MNIVVLTGSPRKNGNSAALAAAFVQGAESAGHTVKVLDVGSMKIAPCLACEYCHGAGQGKCIQQDDMQAVYPELTGADMIVFASAIHYFTMTGQLHALISRFYAFGMPKAKKYAMILSSSSDGVYDASVAQYKAFVSYFGAEDMGVKNFNGENQKTEENFAALRAFGASL